MSPRPLQGVSAVGRWSADSRQKQRTRLSTSTLPPRAKNTCRTPFENCALRSVRFCDEGGCGRYGTRGQITRESLPSSSFTLRAFGIPAKRDIDALLSLMKHMLPRKATNSFRGCCFASRPSSRPFSTQSSTKLGPSSTLMDYIASRTCFLAAPVALAESSRNREELCFAIALTNQSLSPKRADTLISFHLRSAVLSAAKPLLLLCAVSRSVRTTLIRGQRGP